MLSAENILHCFSSTVKYSGGKKNPDLSIKTTENVHLTHRHCKRLITTSTDVLCLYSPLYEIALPMPYYYMLWVELSQLLTHLYVGQ